jgi:hypothetical protein
MKKIIINKMVRFLKKNPNFIYFLDKFRKLHIEKINLIVLFNIKSKPWQSIMSETLINTSFENETSNITSKSTNTIVISNNKLKNVSKSNYVLRVIILFTMGSVLAFVLNVNWFLKEKNKSQLTK